MASFSLYKIYSTDIITQHNRPTNVRRYESVYDVIHMEDPFVIELEKGITNVDFRTEGWDAGIYIMFPLDTNIKPFLMTAKEFRGKYKRSFGGRSNER